MEAFSYYVRAPQWLALYASRWPPSSAAFRRAVLSFGYTLLPLTFIAPSFLSSPIALLTATRFEPIIAANCSWV